MKIKGEEKLKKTYQFGMISPGIRAPHYTPQSSQGFWVSYPLGELRVHHEVVDVFLGFGKLQLSSHHGHHQGCAACALGGGGGNGKVG